MTNVIKKINVDGVEYDIQGKELTKVTYAELKSLRDNRELVEGHLYRITDYEFTTVQADTKSAGHVFDIIVLATSANELSHIARAIAHEGDTYFDGNDLGAWELWYDLDNDTTKYEWADATNGKGVIYRMIDEKRNDCPYDFKNILFYNGKYTSGTTSDEYYYTFSYVVSGVQYDGTVEKQVTLCYGNSIGMYISNKKRTLNKNVWRNTSFGNYCYNNTFGNYCYNNTFGNYCYNNTFGNYCYNNTFGNRYSNNTFGNNCYNNTFGDDCGYNTFGNTCYYNTFGSVCRYNTFGHNCSSNTFGYNCSSNTFGNDCNSHTLRDLVNNREVNELKTSITLNDEYYDDGSGQLVPIKHPDLSTQPSILPYKFMGQYVYEQLIFLGDGKFESGTDSVELSANVPYSKLFSNAVVLSCEGFAYGENIAYGGGGIGYAPIGINGLPIDTKARNKNSPEHATNVLEITATAVATDFGYDVLSGIKSVKAYARIVYTTAPADSSYGYENY